MTIPYEQFTLSTHRTKLWVTWETVVTVEGTLRNNAIQVASIKMLTEIGLSIGQKAPAFSARDQFGHEQNLATLKGPKGTVLLFFRSADW